MKDQTLPDHAPYITTLPILFTHHLDFNAVPQRDFQFTCHFVTDKLEREKLDRFLSIEGAICPVSFPRRQNLSSQHV